MLYKLSLEYSPLLIMDVCLVAVFWLQVAPISLHPHRHSQCLRPGLPYDPKKSLPGKMTSIAGFYLAKVTINRVKHRVKFTSILWPLAANR